METVVNDVKKEALMNRALERVQGDLAAVPSNEIIQVNLDVPSAVTTILGVLPEVRVIREQIAKLPDFDMAAFDKLEDYTLALSFAHASWVFVTSPPDDLEVLSREASELRERLEADVRALSLHGFMDGSPLEKLKGANGYKNVAVDLQGLAKALHAGPALVQGKCGTKVEDLELALQYATRLMRVVGLREQGPAVLAAATEQRMRAFTLTMRTYEETRRAVAYLRARHGDADTIAPSLYTGKGRRKSEPEPAEAPIPAPVPAPAPALAAPAPAPGGAVSAASKGPFMS